MSSRDRDEIAHALIEDREVSWAEVGRRVERHRTTIMREGWQPSGNGCHRRSDLGLPNLNMTPTVAIGRPEELREFLVLGEQIRREVVEHRIVPERPRRHGNRRVQLLRVHLSDFDVCSSHPCTVGHQALRA